MVSGVAYEAGVERSLDRRAEHLKAHLDLDALLEAARGAWLMARVMPRAMRYL